MPAEAVTDDNIIYSFSCLELGETIDTTLVSLWICIWIWMWLAYLSFHLSIINYWSVTEKFNDTQSNYSTWVCFSSNHTSYLWYLCCPTTMNYYNWLFKAEIQGWLCMPLRIKSIHIPQRETNTCDNATGDYQSRWCMQSWYLNKSISDRAELMNVIVNVLHVRVPPTVMTNQLLLTYYLFCQVNLESFTDFLSSFCPSVNNYWLITEKQV